MITIATLRAAGLTDAQIVNVLETDQNERLAARREQNRISQRNYRARKHVSADRADSADSADTPPPSSPSSFSPIPPHITTPSSPTPLRSLRSRLNASRSHDRFEEFWEAYPKRDGGNPKQPARKLYLVALQKGATEEEIILGARAYTKKEAANVGTPYIPQAVKWLRNEYWKDIEVSAGMTEAGRELARKTAEYEAELERRKSNGQAAERAELRSPINGHGTEGPDQDGEPLFPEIEGIYCEDQSRRRIDDD